MKINIKYIFLFCFLSALAYPQNTESISGSLKKLQQKNLHDTSRINLYLTLSSEYISYRNDSTFYFLDQAEDLLKTCPNVKAENDAKYLRSMAYYTISEFDKAQWSINQAINSAKKENDKTLLAQCYNLMGAIQFNLGNYPEAIKQYNNKLEIVKAQGDTISIIETYYNISLINNAEGSYFKSLENNYTALGLSQKIKDSVSMMVVYEGLGISYSKINDIKKAIINLKKALQLAINYGKTYEEAGIWVDLGNVYQQNGEQEKALYYFKRGEETARKNGDKLVESIAISGTGVSLMKQKKYQEAITLFTNANSIHSAVSYKKGLAENQLHIADCNIALGKFREAKRFAVTSLAEAKFLGEKKLEGDAYNSLSRVYEKLNNSDSAYFCFKKYVAISDTINSRSLLRKTTELESKLEKEKILEDRLFAERAAKAELEKQKQIKNTILVAAGIVLLLLIFSYSNYRQKERANIEITEKKKIIEHKNKDILDSINYSKRLQQAVLMSRAEVKDVLPDSILVYLPKDIVSGDFYFIEKDNKGNTHVILAESNKHGVPGAFISIAGNNILKRALKEKGHLPPGKILDFLNIELKAFLKNGENTGINLAYCVIGPEKTRLNYAGANLSAFLINKNRTVTELVPGKNPVGRSDKNSFTDTDIKIEKGDLLYLFSNGLALQQNPNGEEFGKTRLMEVLTNDPTEDKIIHAFNNWKSSAEQTDDVCVIGIKI